MRKLKRFILLGATGILLLGLLVANSYAVPHLGVATQFAYIGGTGQTSLEDYQDYFVEFFVEGTDETHGFYIGPSGSNLIIFTEYSDVHLWLLTNSDVYNTNSPKLGGIPFQPVTEPAFMQKIDGYKPQPYYAVELGTAVDNALGYSWAPLPNSGPNDFPGSQQFYALSLSLDYIGSIAESNYFFVATNNLSMEEGNDFSPKTDSAVGSAAPVPEPASLLLLGTGLIAFAGIGRKKFYKK